MHRQLTNHSLRDQSEEPCVIEATDGPGISGAHHDYVLRVPSGCAYTIHFHDSAQKDNLGQFNGATHEAYLAILEDRLSMLQKGPYPCKENEEALTHIRAAMDALHRRTKERLARGVKGQTAA